MENNTGWIKLHRSIMDTPDWLSEPFTKAQAWVDLLLLANHATGYIRRRGIMVAVGRGQVGYSAEALAGRWKWSKGKVLRFFSDLTKDERISRQISGNVEQSRASRYSQEITEKTVPKKTSVSNLICIINYDKYQMDSTEDDTEDGPKTVLEQEGKEGKERTPRNFSSEIPALMNRYPDQETIIQAFKAISSTRKSNRIADSVKVSVLKKWERYPVESVTAGIHTYLEKGYADQGKDEKYLLGIIRNNESTGKPLPGALSPSGVSGGKVRQSTGDRVLDDHYRGQGWEIRS